MKFKKNDKNKAYKKVYSIVHDMELQMVFKHS